MSTQNRICRAVENILMSSGVNGLTVRNVAREAGVNVAAINHYFISKEELLYSVFKENFELYVSFLVEGFHGKRENGFIFVRKTTGFYFENNKCAAVVEELLGKCGSIKLMDRIRVYVNERVRKECGRIFRCKEYDIVECILIVFFLVGFVFFEEGSDFSKEKLEKFNNLIYQIVRMRFEEKLLY